MVPHESIDPVCVFHGKRASEHDCLYCSLCFENLTPDKCWVDERGQKWDICEPCGELMRCSGKNLLRPLDNA